ncbi:MAG: GntR family transcriptional regulator [Actinomycetota bacterium]|nr:GntR family transcriptional regulator [Actinomycetota bacterium]
MSPLDPAELSARTLESLRQMRVSRVSPQPLHLQASTAIESVLTAYHDAADIPLPSEPDMAAALGIGRPTLRQALANLVQSGRLYTKRGVGTFVAPVVLSRPARLTSLHDDLEAQGLHPSTVVLGLEEILAGEVEAQDLAVPLGTPLVHIRRLREAAGKPLALIDNILNLGGAPAPDRDALAEHGLYATMRAQYGIEMGMASVSVRARLATKAERGLLQQGYPCAVLVARRVAYDQARRGVEIGTTVYAEGASISGIHLQP